MNPGSPAGAGTGEALATLVRGFGQAVPAFLPIDFHLAPNLLEALLEETYPKQISIPSPIKPSSKSKRTKPHDSVTSSSSEPDRKPKKSKKVTNKKKPKPKSAARQSASSYQASEESESESTEDEESDVIFVEASEEYASSTGRSRRSRANDLG